jgi:hypothetical protein
MFVNLTPLVPLSLTRRGGREERGADAPLRRPIKLVSFNREGLRPSLALLKFYRSNRELLDSTFKKLSLPLVKGTKPLFGSPKIRGV